MVERSGGLAEDVEVVPAAGTDPRGEEAGNYALRLARVERQCGRCGQ